MPPPSTATRGIFENWLLIASLSSGSKRRGLRQIVACDFRDHRDKFGMVTDSRGTHHRDSCFARDSRRLNVEVIQHFEMVAQETEGNEYHQAAAGKSPQDLPDVRLQPRVARAAAAALKRERPACASELASNQPRRFVQLLDISGASAHR